MTTTSSSKDWHILRTTGQRLIFQGLAKLQELITNNEVTVEDLLSRDGKKWKRLGDIAELGGIFAEVARRRSMPFGAYDGPPQTMVMPTMTERQAATLTMPTALERSSATLTMPTAVERSAGTMTMPTYPVPAPSPSQETLDGRDMEYTSKASRAPKDIPPQTLHAVSRAPVVLSEHQKPSASPSALKGVQGFHVREEPVARFAETPKLPFATTAPPEAIERRAAATPTAIRAQKLPDETIEHPISRMPSSTTETGAYIANRPVGSPSGRFSAVKPGVAPSGSFAPKSAEPFPARPASPQIPKGQSGSFPVVPRAMSGAYRVSESSDRQDGEEPLSTLRFHSSVESKPENGPPSTLKTTVERAGAEAPLATVRMTSGRFPAMQSPDGSGSRPYANEDPPEFERSNTLKYGPGQVVADIAATVREMPRVPIPEDDEKQKTTLQGVGAVPSRTRVEAEPIAPYTTNSPSSLVSVSPELLNERPRSSASGALSRSGEYRRVEALKNDDKNLAEPVIHRLTSSPLFEKKQPKPEESPSKPAIEAAPSKPKIEARQKPDDDNWQMGRKSSTEDVEDTFLIPNRKKKSRSPLLIGAVIAGGLALLVARPSFLFGAKDPAVSNPSIQPVNVPKQQQLVADGEAMLWLDDDESLKKAPTKFLQALGIEEDYAPALRGLVLSYTILAQRLTQEHQIETLRAATLSKEEASKLHAILEATQKKGEPASLLKEAAQYTEKLAKSAPNDLDAQTALGEFQFVAQDAALSDTLKKVNQYPGSWQEKWLRALDSSRKDPAKSIALLRELLSQKPEMLRARYQLAVMLLQENKIPEARQEAELILKSNPKHNRASDLLLHWSEPTSEPASAVVEPSTNEPTPTTKTTNDPEQPTKTPRTPSEWVQEGDRKMKAGRTSDAISDYLEASSLDRRHLPAYLKAGDAYMKQKGASSAAYACSQYKSALNISPDNADALYGLAACSLQMGNSNEALKHFQRYIDLYPQGKQSASAEKRIKELTKEKAPQDPPKETPKETPKEPTTSPSN
jgi:cytochrome c-type biogenesis protein CcmH/NrfG